MKKFLFASVVMIVAGPALAADLPNDKGPPVFPVAPAFNWTGPYIGVNAGGGWENTRTDYSYSSVAAPAPPGFEDVFGPGGLAGYTGGTAVGNAIDAGYLPTSLGNRSTGVFIAGGQVGYNYQFNQFVIGAETDFDWVNDGVRTTDYSAPANGIVTNNASSKAGLRWLGTARVRLGFAFDRALIFATGGLAYGQVSTAGYSSTYDGSNTDLFSGDASGTRVGFAVGGGVEYAFTNNLSAKLEYLYYDLGTANFAVSPANSVAAGEGIFINGHQKYDGNIVRVGLNYRFDWANPVVAKY
jgi:outer membrane immunogenic protein